MNIDRATIEKLEYKLCESIKKRDLEFLTNIMHDDLLCLAPNSQIITKDIDLASHRAGDMKVEKLTLNIDEVSIIGDTAIAIVTYETKGTMLGKAIEGKFKYNRVWKKIEDNIKIIAASCMQV